MLILGLDFETTWDQPIGGGQLDTAKARILEIGAVLWDTVARAPMLMMSEFIWDGNLEGVTPELEELNGITPALLEEYAIEPEEGLKKLNNLTATASHIVAHNGNNFDRPIYYNECKRKDLLASTLPWIDSREDIPYSKKILKILPGRKLELLAPLHGFINPFPHRALTDVLSMMTILSKYDIDEVIAISQVPTITIRANVQMQDREQAKKRGYQWNPDKKWWTKQIKKNKYEGEIADAPFTITEIIGQ